MIAVNEFIGCTSLSYRYGTLEPISIVKRQTTYRSVSHNWMYNLLQHWATGRLLTIELRPVLGRGRVRTYAWRTAVDPNSSLSQAADGILYWGHTLRCFVIQHKAQSAYSAAFVDTNGAWNWKKKVILTVDFVNGEEFLCGVSPVCPKIDKVLEYVSTGRHVPFDMHYALVWRTTAAYMTYAMFLLATQPNTYTL